MEWSIVQLKCVLSLSFISEPLSSPAFFLSSTKPGEVNVTLLPMLKSLRRGVVLQYSVEYKPHSTDRVERKIILAGNLSFSIGGLQDGQTYSFRLAAATVVGYGPFSDWRSIIVDCTKGEFLGKRHRFYLSPVVHRLRKRYLTFVRG